MLDTTNLRALIEEAGGLVVTSQLAHRWGITREGARLATKGDGFPLPLTTLPMGPAAMPVWVMQDVRAWEDEFRPQEPIEP